MRLLFSSVPSRIEFLMKCNLISVHDPIFRGTLIPVISYYEASWLEATKPKKILLVLVFFVRFNRFCINAILWPTNAEQILTPETVFRSVIVCNAIETSAFLCFLLKQSNDATCCDRNFRLLWREESISVPMKKLIESDPLCDSVPYHNQIVNHSY